MASRPTLRELAELLLGNPYYKALSLFIAIGAWLYVQGGQTTEAKLRATIEWKLPKGLATAEPLPATVSITVRGSRSATRRAMRSEVVMEADLTESKVGEHIIEVSALEIHGMPPNVTILGFSPSSVRMVLDEQTTRKVKVNPVVIGEPAQGLEVASKVAEPSVVQVRGPRSVMAELRSIDTKPVDVSNLRVDGPLPAEVDLPWGTKLAGAVAIAVQVDLEPVVAAQVFEGVPVVVRDSEQWHPTQTQVQVTLQGPAKVLEAIAPDQVVALVHLPTNAQRTSYQAHFGPIEGLRITVVHPSMDEVSAVAVKPEAVEVVRR